MPVIRKTNRKDIRNIQRLNRVRSVEQKLTFFEMFEQFMNYKQTKVWQNRQYSSMTNIFIIKLNSDGDLSNDNITLEFCIIFCICKLFLLS